MSNEPRSSTTLPRALRLARDFGAVVFGKYGQYLVTFATVPLLARVLGPAGMGLLAVGMAAYFFGSIVVDLGMTPFLAARVPELRNTPAELQQVRTDYLTVRLMTLGVLGAALGTGWIAGVPPYVHMILLGLFTGGFWAASDDWLLIGQGRFIASAIYQGSGRITYLLLLVVLLPHSPPCGDRHPLSAGLLDPDGRRNLVGQPADIRFAVSSVRARPNPAQQLADRYLTTADHRLRPGGARHLLGNAGRGIPGTVLGQRPPGQGDAVALGHDRVGSVAADGETQWP
ncbi:Probable O-antigen transporter, MOP superfamily [Mycobacteroides abscessus subsp. massiliense]|nr:Probable O-antigen transporter, MOP superfamily [Mycobacteroides abscessus subsp. massiliense]